MDKVELMEWKNKALCLSVSHRTRMPAILTGLQVIMQNCVIRRILGSRELFSLLWLVR